MYRTSSGKLFAPASRKDSLKPLFFNLEKVNFNHSQYLDFHPSFDGLFSSLFSILPEYHYLIFIFRMFIPQANRKAIHTYLFNGTSLPAFTKSGSSYPFFSLLEGVIVVKKNYYQKEHESIPVPNIEVMKALQSLKSRGFVSETFSWQYYYYILTEEGITFLRAQLNLPESVVPATVAKAMKAPVSERPTRGGTRCISV